MPKNNPISPVRGQILMTARGYTCGDRNASYGDPTIQLDLAGQLKRLCWEAKAIAWSETHQGRVISDAEHEAIDMVITKLSRLIIGPAPGRDTYIDIAAYAAIAGEAAAVAARLEEEANNAPE